MRRLGVRARMLLASLAPAVIVALLLGGILLAGRFQDIETGLQQRAMSIAQQTAATVEYPLFIGDAGTLGMIAAAAARDPQVVSIAVLGERGNVLARVGEGRILAKPVPVAKPQVERDGRARVLRLTLPVHATGLALDDPIYGVLPKGAADDRRVVGYVAAEVSLERVEEERRRLAAWGVVTMLGSLLLGAILAQRIAREVSRPVELVADTVRRIGRGELDARVPSLAQTDDMRRLEIGVNEMAAQVALTQEELQRRIEEATLELRRKKDEAEAATQAKSRFLAAASHDLRQPVQALGLFISRLVQHRHATDVRELVNWVDESVRNLQNLVEELLDVSRLDAGTIRARPRDFAIGEMLERLNVDYIATVSERGLRFAIRPCARRVVSDPILLERILRNLIANALRYTTRGRVWVACRPRGDRLRIEVWDTGCGIPASEQQEIFREFVQLANPERDRAKGLGLGLSIVERLCALLGHEITVCSRVGHGSRFAVSVPLANPATAQPPEEEEPAPEEPHVLVVDDAPYALREQLENWGCRVTVATSGAAGLAAMPRGEPSRILFCADRLGNGETGFDIIAAFRQRCGRKAAVVLICADADPAMLARAESEGVLLLMKPYRPARLRTLLNAVLMEDADEEAS